MRLEDLRNYGQPQTVFDTCVPQDVMAEIGRCSSQILARRLGPDQLQRFGSTMAAEKERLLQLPLTAIRQKPWMTETFIAARVEGAAMFAALSQVVGRERTFKILMDIGAMAAPMLAPYWWPTAEEFLSFPDPFAALRAWMLSLWEADREIGAHEFDLAEDTDDAVQINVTYCGWYDTYKALRMGEACWGSATRATSSCPCCARLWGSSTPRPAPWPRGGPRATTGSSG